MIQTDRFPLVGRGEYGVKPCGCRWDLTRSADIYYFHNKMGNSSLLGLGVLRGRKYERNAELNARPRENM